MMGEFGLNARSFFQFLFICSLVGCDNIESPTTSLESKEDNTLRSHQVRGPIELTVEITPAKPRLSDEPRLTLTIRSEPGVRVEKPPFGEAFGEFLIRDFYEPMSTVDGKAEVIRQVYTLEPTRPGKLTVAPLAVTFHDARPQGDHQSHTIESESLVVEVSTVLDDQIPTLADLRPESGPLQLPRAGLDNAAWIVAALLAVAIGSFIYWRRQRRKTLVEPQRSPRELAWLELENLVASKLAELDPKQYYVELTGVVRRFIERATGVRAPEQTTEEFLREIAQNHRFINTEQSRLRAFLESADLVKFAGVQPHAADIEASFERAQRFIGLLDEPTQQEVAA